MDSINLTSHGKSKLFFGSKQAFSMKFKSTQGVKLQDIRNFCRRESDIMKEKGITGRLYVNVKTPAGV